VIGLAGFVMFIFGAVRYMFSGGNTQHAQTARQMMTYSVIGLVVALSAFIIINLIANFTGVSIITRFGIPTSDFQY
jgi:flagellar basal body-associated protein FliL